MEYFQVGVRMTIRLFLCWDWNRYGIFHAKDGLVLNSFSTETR